MWAEFNDSFIVALADEWRP